MNFWCFPVLNFLLVCNIVVANPVINKSDEYLVGVSNKKLNNLVKRALEGLRNIIRDGDDKLKMDSLEPYTIEDDLMTWYDDGIGQTRVHCSSRGVSFLHGLSSYTVESVSASMSELDAEMKLKFNLLQGFGNYKLGGHLFGGIVLLSGNGTVAVKSPKVDATICVNMSLAESKIQIDETSVNLNLSSLSAKATNVMDVPGLHATAKVNEILRRLYARYKTVVDNFVNDVIGQVAENTFTGMTLKELIDLLKYLSQKASLSSALPNEALAEVS